MYFSIKVFSGVFDVITSEVPLPEPTSGILATLSDIGSAPVVVGVDVGPITLLSVNCASVICGVLNLSNILLNASLCAAAASKGLNAAFWIPSKNPPPPTLLPMPAPNAPRPPDINADLAASFILPPCNKVVIPEPNAAPYIGPAIKDNAIGKTAGATFLAIFLMPLNSFLKKNSG